MTDSFPTRQQLSDRWIERIDNAPYLVRNRLFQTIKDGTACQACALGHLLLAAIDLGLGRLDGDGDFFLEPDVGSRIKQEWGSVDAWGEGAEFIYRAMELSTDDVSCIIHWNDGEQLGPHTIALLLKRQLAGATA